MPRIPEANTTNCKAYDESMYGREEPTKRTPGARVITWKPCEKCEELTLHKFEGEDGECLKCENKKGDNHK